MFGLAPHGTGGKAGKQDNNIRRTVGRERVETRHTETYLHLKADTNEVRATVPRYAKQPADLKRGKLENVGKNLVTQSQTQLRFAAASAITCHGQRVRETEREQSRVVRGLGGTRELRLLKDMWHLAWIVQRAEKYLHILKCKQSTRRAAAEGGWRGEEGPGRQAGGQELP